MKRITFLSCLLSITLFLNAAKVDTLLSYSRSMNKEIKTCVVTPDSYDKNGKAYPVLYMIHGWSGNYASWVNDFPQVKEFSDLYNMIIVGVDGNYDSWYFDSPVDSTLRYETYVSKEVVAFIDSKYNTIKSREGRAIMGLSMGGHGALYLSLRNQDVYGAAGSMSGGVDIRPFPKSWGLDKKLGNMAEYPENWENNTVMNQLYLAKDKGLALMIDCGINDFFIDVNRQLHEKMLYMNIEHDYIERPGAHNRDYWDNAIYYQVLFMHKFFGAEKK